MAEQTLKISYKIYMDAEDVSQSRILSCVSNVESMIKNHKNTYIKQAEFDNESDMEDFVLRFYVEEQIEEEDADTDQAEAFLDELAELLDEIAHAHSFLDMEGSFSIDFAGEHIAYTFSSEAGDGLCEFIEQTT